MDYIDILNIVKKCGIIDDLNEIIMDYIGICMYCQKNIYPIYNKKIDGYKICVECIWSVLTSSNDSDFKYKDKQKCNRYYCLNCNEIFLSKREHKNCVYKSYYIRNFEYGKKCWCGVYFNDKTQYVKHKNEIIHQRNLNINKKLLSIYNNKFETILLLYDTIPIFMEYLNKEIKNCKYGKAYKANYFDEFMETIEKYKGILKNYKDISLDICIFNINHNS